MEKHMAKLPVGKRTLSHADQLVIGKLSALADYGDESTRLQETVTLVNFLKEKQGPEKELCGDVVYAVGRLVRGLASGRQLARLGFSIALCQLLRRMPEITVDYLLGVVEKEFGILQSGQSSKGESSNISLGKTFAYLTLIRSERLFRENEETIKTVMTQLYQACKQKSQHRVLGVKGISQVMEQMDTKMFSNTVWPAIQEDFKLSWEDCDPELLMLILTSSRCHMTVVKDFLEEHWSGKHIVSEKNFSHIARILTLCTAVLPHHPVVTEIITYVVREKVDVVKFWKEAVRPLFDSSHHRKSLGLSILLQLLPSMDVKTQLKEIMNSGVYALLYTCRHYKENLIMEKISQVLTGLTDLAKTSTDHEVQLVVLRSLFSVKRDLNFDPMTRTTTVSTIINHLLPEAAVKLSTDLMKVSLKCSTPEEAGKMTIALKELASLATRTNTDVQLKILQFLCLHGYFTIKSESKDIPHCHGSRVSGEFASKATESARQFFYKTLGNIVSFSTTDQNRVVQFGHQLDVLYQLSEYVQTLLDHPEVVSLHEGVLPDESVEEWQKVTTVVQTIHTKRVSEEKIGNSHAFELLFLYTAFDLFMETEKAMEVLQDLHVCYQKSTERKKTKANDDEPAWIEVLTELLLSMLSTGSKLSRSVVKTVFSSLGDHVTAGALDLIADVLQQGVVGQGEDEDGEGPITLADMDEMEEESEEDNDSDEDDDDDDDADEKTDEEEEEDEEEEDEEEGDESEDSGVEEEEDIAVDERVREELKTALGAAAVKSEDEDEDESDDDLSDSEMFKLDDILARTFKKMLMGGKKKAKKEQAKELLNLKLRVLDMLESYMKKHVSIVAVKTLLLPLLDLLEVSSRRTEEMPLHSRVTDLLSIMCRMKKTSQGGDEDREEMMEVFKKLLDVSTTVSENTVVMVAKATLLVAGLLLNIEVDITPSPVRTRHSAKETSKKKGHKGREDYETEVVDMVQSALLKIFQKQGGSSSPKFFLTVLEGYPLLFWPISEVLITTAGDVEKKIFMRTKAFGLLSVLINKNSASNLGQVVWQEFMTSLKPVVLQAVDSLSSDELKSRFIQELMSVLVKVLNVSTEDCAKIVSADVMKTLCDLRSKFNKDQKRLFKRLAVLHPENRQSQTGKKRKLSEGETDGTKVLSKRKLKKLQRKLRHQESANNANVATTKIQTSVETAKVRNSETIQVDAADKTAEKEKEKKNKKDKKKQKRKSKDSEGTESDVAAQGQGHNPTSDTNTGTPSSPKKRKSVVGVENGKDAAATVDVNGKTPKKKGSRKSVTGVKTPKAN